MRRLVDLFVEELDKNYPLTVELITMKISKDHGLWHVDLENKALLKQIMNSLRYQQKLKAKSRLQKITMQREARKQKVHG